MVGVVSKDFIVDSMAKIVGDRNVITSYDELVKYSSDHSFVRPEIPICVVKPGSTEEVQEILRFANSYRVPITPLSGGTNNLGGTIPAANGIVIDLRRMNKILDVDTKAWMASIEPGVTFAQLQEEVSKYGLRVLTPSELPSHSSALSTYLDLAPLYGWVYYGEEILTTMTIVLPSGDVIKTGQQAFPQIKWPYVSSHASPFAGLMNYIWYQSQGTLGVVTQGWIKLKPVGEVVKPYFIPLDEVDKAYEVVRRIMWLRYPRDMAIMNKVDLAQMFADETSRYSDKVKEMLEVLPEWTIMFLLRGRREAVDVMEQDIRDVASKLDVKLLDEVPGVEKSGELFLSEVRTPSGWVKWSKYRGARTVLPFIASLKDVPAMVRTTLKLAEQFKFPREYIGVTIIQTDRIGVVHCGISFARNPLDAEESRIVKTLYTRLAEELLSLGAFYSRPYGILARLMYSRTQTYYETMMKIKRIIDPNNIMNPRRLNIHEEW